MIENEKRNMTFDTMIYLFGKVLEGVVGIVSVSIFLRVFPTIMFGQYGMINTTIQIAVSFCTLWISQSVYRFLSQYKYENKLDKFYSTTFVCWLIVNLSSIIFFISFIFLTKETLLKEYNFIWLLLACFSFVTLNTSTILTTALASCRKTKSNLFLSVFAACGKLCSIVFFVTFFKHDIKWIFVSNFIFDGLVSVIAFKKLKINEYIKIKSFSTEVLKRFGNYGTPLLGSILTTTVLNSSDRYFVNHMTSDIAIYLANYSIISTLFTMINTAVARGSVPTIVKVWATGDEKYAYHLISQTVKYYLMLIVPAVTGIFMISEEIMSFMSKNPYYVKGHLVMFWVSLALAFSFLCECSNKPFELNKKTKYILFFSGIGAIVNIILNFILIPRYGYMVASITTFIGFFVYFLSSKALSISYTKWQLGFSFYIKIVLSSLIMAFIIYLLQQKFGTSLLFTFVDVFVGAIIYVVCLYSSGLIKKEIHQILKKLK